MGDTAAVRRAADGLRGTADNGVAERLDDGGGAVRHLLGDLLGLFERLFDARFVGLVDFLGNEGLDLGGALEERLHILHDGGHDVVRALLVDEGRHGEHDVERDVDGHLHGRAEAAGVHAAEDRAADVGGAERRDEHARRAGDADRRGHGEDHGLLHLLGRAVFQMNGRGGDGGGAGAVALQIAAGGDLRHAEQAADLEHQAGDLGESGLVGADVHQRAQETGVRAGVARAGARTHADAVVADFGGHGVHERLVEQHIGKDGAGAHFLELGGNGAEQEAVSAGNADLHGLEVVRVLFHDGFEHALAVKTGAKLALGEDNVHHAHAVFFRKGDRFAHRQRKLFRNYAFQICHILSPVCTQRPVEEA